MKTEWDLCGLGHLYGSSWFFWCATALKRACEEFSPKNSTMYAPIFHILILTPVSIHFAERNAYKTASQQSHTGYSQHERCSISHLCWHGETMGKLGADSIRWSSQTRRIRSVHTSNQYLDVILAASRCHRETLFFDWICFLYWSQNFSWFGHELCYAWSMRSNGVMICYVSCRSCMHIWVCLILLGYLMHIDSACSAFWWHTRPPWTYRHSQGGCTYHTRWYLVSTSWRWLANTTWGIYHDGGFQWISCTTATFPQGAFIPPPRVLELVALVHCTIPVKTRASQLHVTYVSMMHVFSMVCMLHNQQGIYSEVGH